MTQWIRNWFSNFIPLDKPFEYQGMLFHTVENFYQAMKTKDIRQRRKIATVSASESKKLGRKITLRKDWEQIKVDVMRYGLRKKFCKGSSHLTKLLKTSGEIVEWNNWHDRIWGKCVCPRCNKQGQNLLGELLTEIRKDNSLMKY